MNFILRFQAAIKAALHNSSNESFSLSLSPIFFSYYLLVATIAGNKFRKWP